MNIKNFMKKNIYKTVQIRPGVIRKTTDGGTFKDDDEWRVMEGAEGTIGLRNTRTEHHLSLGVDNIKEFRTPNFLLLRCQITLQDNGFKIDPLPSYCP